MSDTTMAQTEHLRDVRWTRDFVLAGTAAAALGLLIYSLQVASPGGTVGALFDLLGWSWALGAASFIAGATVGLLFGIPRSRRARIAGAAHAPATLPSESSSAPTVGDSPTPADGTGFGEPRLHANANLEEISDWLTKIIIGLGLSKLSQIPGYVHRLTYFLTHSGGTPANPGMTQGFALAILTAFGGSGFLMGYLMTRLFLYGALSRAERPAAKVERALGEIARDTPPPAPPTGATAIPESGMKQAIRVESISAGISTAALRAQITRLAKEYETLRLAMSSGSERTTAMERVAAQMKSLALAAQTLLDDLKNSSSDGERLAAVTFLQVKPRADSIDWLAERIVNEKPFIGYQAAVALLAAVRALTPAEKEPLKRAITKGMDALAGKEGTDRHAVLVTAKKELEQG